MMKIAAWVVREIADQPYGGDGLDSNGKRVDPDVVDALGDEIATLTAHVHAVTQRLLELIARFDRLKGWERYGYKDCAQWLSVRTGIDRGAAQEKVRAARALTELPLIRAAMGRGELSFSKVRALTRAATPANESDLLELAVGTTTAQLERVVRAWKKSGRGQEIDQERERHEARGLSIFPDDDGSYVIRGRLTPEVGALLMRAIDAAGSQLFSRPDAAARSGERDEGRARKEAAQRRADALGLVAERALCAGFGSGAPISGGRARLSQLEVHVDAGTLSATGSSGRADLEDGTRLSAESARRLACDSTVVDVRRGSDGSVLDVGRRTRTISPRLRRALEVRDRGCRFPGCGLRFTDAHHLTHWADGGHTSLENCMLLCRHHHRLVHEGGWTMGKDREGRPIFFDPKGGMHYDGQWRSPTLPEDPTAALLDEHARLGIAPTPWTAAARWERDARIPPELELRAREGIQDSP